MKLKIFISCVCYLFLICCQEENFSHQAPCFRMYFSPAQPLEFWITGCQTFNERSVCGAHASCYCIPFNCDDPIKMQFTDDDQDGEFLIIVYDEDGNQLFSDTPEKTDLLDSESNYVKSVYDYSFIPSQTSPDLCNSKIRVKVYSVVTVSGTEDPYDEYLFTSNLEGWVNTTVGGSTSDWAWSADEGGTAKNTTVETFAAKTLRVSGITAPQQEFFIRIQYQILNANSNGLFLRFIIRDSGATQLQNNTFSTPGPHASMQTAVISVTDSAVWTDAFSYEIATTSTDYDAGDIIYISSVEIYTEQTTNVEEAKTDCIHIKESHSCTQLIRYTQERNYVGLIYQNNSPNIEFYFRVPAVFFRQRFPKVQESMNLSQAVINLNSTIKVQRLFSTDYLPGYIHRKLNFILSHQYVEIDNQTWVAEEEYELIDTNRMNQKQKGQIWLTESDFLARNVI